MQADLPIPPISTEEAEATMTTSADKVATLGSHATLGETTVRVTFILLWSVSVFWSWGVMIHFIYYHFCVSFLVFFLFFPPLHTLNYLRMSRGDPRNIIEYRDLDAPDDMDFF